MEKTTLLLVEDEALIALNTKRQLEQEGYEVLHVSTGEKALQFLTPTDTSCTDEEISLVLMDINLGSGIDGIETAKRLLAVCDVPTVFLSSHSDPDVVRRTEEVTAYGYIQKSSPISILTASIRMALRLHNARTLADSSFTQAINGVCFHRLFFDDAIGKYDCEYLAVNPSFTTHTGVQPEQALNTTIRGLYPNDDRVDAIIDVYRKAINQEISNQQEVYFAPTQSWFDLSIFPIRGKDFTVLISNITDRKVAEERYRLVFETMGPGIVYQERDGAISSANPAAERLLGLSLDQMKGVTSADPRWKMIMESGETVPGDQHPSMIALATGKRVGPVDRGVYIPEDDRYVWLSITAIPLFRPDEETPEQVFATFEDITARKEAEKALYAQKEQYRITISSIGDAVIATDVRGCITYMNPVAERLCGCTLAHAYDREIAECFSIKSSLTQEFIASPVEEVLRTGNTIALANHTILVSQDGAEYQIADSAAPIMNDGELLGVVLVFRDVTDEYETKENLKHLVEEKELLIKEVQHRIKNLMNTMASIIELQMADLKDKTAVEVLREIQTRFAGMATLYDYLYRSTDHTVDTEGYLTTLVTQVARIFEDGLQVDTSIDSSCSYDAKTLTTLGMIVTELVTNAMKYAVRNNPDPVLRVSLSSTDGNSILQVQDNGPGMPLEANTTSFGTSLVKALVNQIHGTMHINNDAGTKITIQF